MLNYRRVINVPTSFLPSGPWHNLGASEQCRISGTTPDQRTSVGRHFPMGISDFMSSEQRHWLLLSSRIFATQAVLEDRDGISLQSRRGKYAVRLIKIETPCGIKEDHVCFQVFHRLKFSTFQVFSGVMKLAACVASHGPFCIATWDFRSKGNQCCTIKG